MECGARRPAAPWRGSGTLTATGSRCRRRCEHGRRAGRFVRPVDHRGHEWARRARGYLAVIGELTLPDRIRACLFDLDGVLTQTATTHAAAWKEMFDAFLSAWSAQDGRSEAPFDEQADYQRYVDGRPRLDGVKAFLDSRGITLPVGDADAPPGTDTMHALGNWKNELVLQRLQRGQIGVYDGSVQFVAAVRGAGRSTAVVSSSANTHAVLDTT